HRAWFEADPDRYQSPTAALLAAQCDRPAYEYIHAARAVARLRHDVVHRLRTVDKLDALITVTTGVRSAPLTSDPVELRAPLLQMGIPFSVLGVPAVSVPAPDGGSSPDGLPTVGLTGRTQRQRTPPAGLAAV